MKNNKKTLFYINYIPPDYGGGYLRAFNMASRFKENNHLAGIITLTNKELFKKTNNISSDDILFLNSKCLLIIKLINYLLNNRNNFDKIYIVSSHWHTLFASLICKIISKKIIIGITLSGVDSPVSKSLNPIINLYYKIKNLQFRLADKIIMNSPAVLKECIDYNINAEKLKLIPNPVDIHKFQKTKEKKKIKSLRQSFGILNSDPIILFVGSINKRKGVDLFPEILSELSKDIKHKINFIICGNIENDYSNRILNDIEMICKDSIINFIFLGQINNTNDLMSISDILLFPTRNEGLPNVILEAMSSSCVIFTNLLSGITDYLLPSEFIINDNNIISYVSKLSEVLYRPNIHDQITIANRKKVVSEFNFETIDKLFLEI